MKVSPANKLALRGIAGMALLAVGTGHLVGIAQGELHWLNLVISVPAMMAGIGILSTVWEDMQSAGERNK